MITWPIRYAKSGRLADSLRESAMNRHPKEHRSEVTN